MGIKKKVAGGGAVLALAAAIITPWEGTKLYSYQDAVGVWTICAGHTGTAGPNQLATPEQCDRLLKSDMGVALAAVDRVIDTPLPDKTKAAFVSFTFNVGAGNLQSSTLARKANAGDLVGACKELSRWVYAGGQRLRGLVNRRAEERAICLEGVSDAEQGDSQSDALGAGGSAGPWHWFEVATGWITGRA